MSIYNPTHAYSVTPSDTLPNSGTILYVGGAGDVALVLAGDTVAVTFKAVPVGTRLEVQFSRVMSTNTTATLLLALS